MGLKALYEALLSGKKITKPHWQPGEYLCLKKNRLIDEKGNEYLDGALINPKEFILVK